MPYNTRYLFMFLVFAAAILAVSGTHFPILSKQADILIVSPHPDDAVLCCGGLIQQALDQKKRVHIVELTDGDGYVDAAAVLFNKPAATLTLRNLQQLGRTRAHEEIRAMNMLGVSRPNITFLGYPDGWLDEVYKDEGVPPFTNPFTGISTSRIGRKPYAKQSVVTDLTNIIRQTRPDAIYVSEPADTALDHQVAYLFVIDAIKASGYTNQLFTYAIHRTDEATRQSPVQITLSQHQKTKKSAALEQYKTQTMVDAEYLRSFVTNTEYFLH